MTSTDGVTPQTLIHPGTTRHIRGFLDTRISRNNARLDKLHVRFQSFYLDFDSGINADLYFRSLARNVDEIQTCGRGSYRKFHLNRPLRLRNNRHVCGMLFFERISETSFKCDLQLELNCSRFIAHQGTDLAALAARPIRALMTCRDHVRQSRLRYSHEDNYLTEEEFYQTRHTSLALYHLYVSRAIEYVFELLKGNQLSNGGYFPERRINTQPRHGRTIRAQYNHITINHVETYWEFHAPNAARYLYDTIRPAIHAGAFETQTFRYEPNSERNEANNRSILTTLSRGRVLSIYNKTNNRIRAEVRLRGSVRSKCRRTHYQEGLLLWHTEPHTRFPFTDALLSLIDKAIDDAQWRYNIIHPELSRIIAAASEPTNNLTLVATFFESLCAACLEEHICAADILDPLLSGRISITPAMRERFNPVINRLERAGILERVRYQSRERNRQYALTAQYQAMWDRLRNHVLVTHPVHPSIQEG